MLRGFAQKAGINYGEVFAHVLRSDTLRTLFACTVQNDWDIHGLDVASAFLNGRVEEEIYMRQIPGYEDGSSKVLCVKGSLYGLKQAPRIWNKTFAKKIMSYGYKRANSDPSVYIRRRNGKMSILAVYVDDIALFTTKGYGHEAKVELMGMFEMRDLGELSSFLGYRIDQDRNKGTLTLSQGRYIKSIVERAGLADANTVVLPMAAGTQFKRYEGPRIDFPYATRIGELLYAALGAHPEIAFAVQHLSQFTKNPGPEHIAAIKHLYRYLKGAADEGITYSRDGSDQPEIFVDADWAQDILDCRSISGHVFMLSGGAISWSSKKQATVCREPRERNLFFSFVNHAEY